MCAVEGDSVDCAPASNVSLATLTGAAADAEDADHGSAQSHVGLPFVRTSAYYRTLLVVFNQCDSLASNSLQPEKGQRARAAAATYFAQICSHDRLAGADGRQRALALFDARVAAQLLPLTRNGTANVRACALLAASRALAWAESCADR